MQGAGCRVQGSGFRGGGLGFGFVGEFGFGFWSEPARMQEEAEATHSAHLEMVEG